MCNWQDKVVDKGKTKTIIRKIPEQVFSDACRIIHQMAQERRVICYSDLEYRLKNEGHGIVSRLIIGDIVGEVSIQVSQVTNPSIYPSAIVVHKNAKTVGEGFWGIDTGTNPPSKYQRLSQKQKENLLQQYRNDVFNRLWNCNC